MKRYIIALTLFFAAISTQGQSLSFLNIIHDAQALAMGGTSVAMKGDYASIYNNPAAMSLSSKTLSVGATYGMWQPQLNDNTILSFSGYYKVGEKLGVGIGGRYFTYPEYYITNKDGYITGSYAPKDYSADLGLSYMVMPNLSIGATVRYISSTLSEAIGGNAIGADVAIMYKLNDLNIALAATNLGSSIQYGSNEYPLPTMVKGGLSYSRDLSDLHNVTLNVEGDYMLSNSSIMAGLGVRYCYQDMASFAVGYHYGNSNQLIPSYASAGLGFKFKGVGINASYLLPIGNDLLKNTIMISLSFEL